MESVQNDNYNIKHINFKFSIDEMITHPNMSKVEGKVSQIVNEILSSYNSSASVTIFIHLQIMCKILELTDQDSSIIYQKYNSIVHNEHETVDINKDDLITHIIKLYSHDFKLKESKKNILDKLMGTPSYESIKIKMRDLDLIFLQLQTIIFLKRKAIIDFTKEIEKIDKEFIDKYNILIDTMKYIIQEP